MIHQALTGLQHIQELGLVHRDLKPANLMLVPAPAKGEADTTLRATLKILDIGLGRALFEESNPSGEDKVELTGEGVILGTPDYLAPEQARDPRTIDIRADIYSLGCVLYHLLSGQTPFPDTNLINQMVRHATETPKPLQQLNPAIPDGLQQIVNYMIAKQASQRYPSPERAAQALQIFLMADAQAPRALEEPPQLRNYLTWLETSDPNRGTPLKPAFNPALPAGKNLASPPSPKTAPQPVRSSKPTPVPSTRSPAARKKHKKHRSSRHGRVPVGTPASGGPAAQPAVGRGAQEFDVELVPIPSAAPVPTSMRRGGKEIRADQAGMDTRGNRCRGSDSHACAGGHRCVHVVLGLMSAASALDSSPV